MLLYAASVCLFLYCSVSLLRGTPRALRACGVLLLALAAAKYGVYKLLGGSFFAPDLPYALVWGYEAAYGALIILFCLLLLRDVLLGTLWLGRRLGHCGAAPAALGRQGGACASRVRRIYGLCAVVLALCLGLWGTWQGTRVPDVRTVTLQVRDLPPQLEGFSLVQLSDMHIGGLFDSAWLESVVDKAAALQPQMVVLTGDYIDGTVEQLREDMRPLRRFSVPVFGVTGNHEYFWGAAAWIRELENLGITMLQNAHRVLDVKGVPLVVAGVTDTMARRTGAAAPDLTRALHAAPAGTPTGLRLLLQHQPKTARANATQVDVQLSGHTHGGLMFFLQPVIRRFNDGFVRGVYALDRSLLYVSSGTGLWGGFACRVGVPAEITHIILRRG